jgi:hypothetical protein
VVDPMQAPSCEIGQRAAQAGDTSLWLLLSETMVAALAQDIGALESSKDIWDRAEGWVDMHELECRTDAGRADAKSQADVKNQIDAKHRADANGREAGLGR